MNELSKKIGELEYDGLISGLNPACRVTGGTIAKAAENTTILRGSVLGRAEDTGLLSLYDGTTIPVFILCEDTEVGTDEDVNVAVFEAGCFDPNKVHVAAAYELTAEDKDTLRKYNIVFKAKA